MRVLNQLIELWKQLGLNQKISLILATLLVGGAMAGILMWSARPDMQMLYGRLDPKDAGDIVTALEAQGVPYQLSAGGTSISVPRNQVYRVRADLATKNMPGGSSVGMEIFDHGNFGMSDFIQRTNYLRATQGELERTIKQFNGVRSARVMVVMPENRLLVTDTSRRATASVLIDSGGGRLPSDAVNSIRSLVANAVEGLKMDDVVVADTRGNTLSEELRQDNLGVGMSPGQIRYRKGIEDYYSHKVEGMLATVVGPGNAVVRVSVDVDTTASTTVEEKFDPDGQVLRSSQVTEDSNHTAESRAAGGAAGVQGNVAADASSTNPSNPSSNTQQTKKTKTESYEIGRSTTNTVHNPGDIRRVSAAVFVAMRSTGAGDARQTQPRTAEQIDVLRKMVVNALGVQAARGQTIDQMVTLQEMDFATDQAGEQQAVVLQKDEKMKTYIDLGRNALYVLLGAGAFFYFVRLLRRSQSEAPLLEAYGGNQAPGQAGELTGEVTPAMLNQLIRQKPDNVGLTLKQWMSADQK